MAAKMQDAHAPASQLESFTWATPAAYGVDRTGGTHRSGGLENLDQAKSNYGAIVYNKAPSVLKQLNYLVGDSAFRAGVQRFLTRHAYENATWRDLLAAIGTAGNRSLAAWGDAYILRPGMPVLEQRAVVRDPRCRRWCGGRRGTVEAPAGLIRTELLAVYDRGETLRIPLTISAETTAVPSSPAGRRRSTLRRAGPTDSCCRSGASLPGRDVGSVRTPSRRVGGPVGPGANRCRARPVPARRPSRAARRDRRAMASGLLSGSRARRSPATCSALPSCPWNAPCSPS
jgi:hypothetical protein